jgi:hypothetical protein
MEKVDEELWLDVASSLRARPIFGVASAALSNEVRLTLGGKLAESTGL